MLVVSAYISWNVLLPQTTNPLAPFVRISYPLPRTLGESAQHYDKGSLDICFLAFYVVAFSFTRQSITEYIVKPFGRYHGIRSETKTARLMEQGYTFIYFLVFGSLGLVRFLK
jgi:acyl-CoA-dependent ceramide synthase